MKKLCLALLISLTAGTVNVSVSYSLFFVAIALTPSVVVAQVPDPTGAWLIRTDIQVVNTPGVFLLTVFH
jgi:hypothetical protein